MQRRSREKAQQGAIKCTCPVTAGNSIGLFWHHLSITSEHWLAVDLCQMTLASLLWLTSDHHTCTQG